MRQGAELWAEGKQSTPWANYLFKPETYVAAPDESEPFSEDLLKANMLDEEENTTFGDNENNKENSDGGK